jgi:hypothetical protein
LQLRGEGLIQHKKRPFCDRKNLPSNDSATAGRVDNFARCLTLR